MAPTEGWPQHDPASSCPLRCPAPGQGSGSVFRAGLAFPGCAHNEPAAGQGCSRRAQVCVPFLGGKSVPRPAPGMARARLLPHPDRGCHCVPVEPRVGSLRMRRAIKPLGSGKTALGDFVHGFSIALRMIRINPPWPGFHRSPDGQHGCSREDMNFMPVTTDVTEKQVFVCFF